jgi:hypothetical protein
MVWWATKRQHRAPDAPSTMLAGLGNNLENGVMGLNNLPVRLNMMVRSVNGSAAADSVSCAYR